jgi:ferredoxin
MGQGQCIGAQPESFAFDDEISVVQPAAALLTDELVREVARLCPVRAVSAVDESGQSLTIT